MLNTCMPGAGCCIMLSSLQVSLPAGQHIEYKYVILEEQDWTKLENEETEGVVEISYRSGAAPGSPPDVHTITRQMAIVAWQPGPNRILQVPSEVRLHACVHAHPPRAATLEPMKLTWRVCRPS